MLELKIQYLKAFQKTGLSQTQMDTLCLLCLHGVKSLCVHVGIVYRARPILSLAGSWGRAARPILSLTRSWGRAAPPQLPASERIGLAR